MRDTLREIWYIAMATKYYRQLYEDIVPREHRAPSYATSRSARSQMGTESRGVMGPSRCDPPGGDLGAGTSTMRPSTSGDSHT